MTHYRKRGFVVDYRRLGTISIDELKQAIFADLEALKDIYGARFVTGPILRIFPTNEYGEDCPLHKPGGSPLNRLDTHHYRPACRDYEL